MFVKSSPPFLAVLLVDVDDLVLVGNTMAEISAVKQVLDTQFRIKDLRCLRFFLGLEVARFEKGIVLDQRKYALELLEGNNVLAVKPSATPSDPSAKLTSDRRNSYFDQFAYRRLIGHLLYLTNT